MEQIVLDPEPQLLDVGAGAKAFGCRQLEHETKPFEFQLQTPPLDLSGDYSCTCIHVCAILNHRGKITAEHIRLIPRKLTENLKHLIVDHYLVHVMV